MTRDEILRMEAGTDLDYLIAQKIFGLKVSKKWGDTILCYSSDIKAAWEVVEKMHRDGNCLSLTYQTGLLKDDFNKFAWLAWFRLSREAYYVSVSPTEAICKASLLSLLGDEN